MSLRRVVLNTALRALVKPVLRHSSDPVFGRRAFALSARLFFRRPPFVVHLPDRLGALPCAVVSCGPARPRRAILYFHGGGYIAGSPVTHMGLIAAISRRTGLRIYAPDYRLAPEHPAPAQFEDACAAWQALIGRGYRPGDIALGGDSAGGGLALALLSHLCRGGTPPAALFAFSPWTDPAGSGASLKINARCDPVFPADRFGVLADIVLQGGDPRDPRIAPLDAAFPGCPPVFLQFSGDEILADDSRRMAPRLDGAVLDEWSGLPHVWTLFAGWLPEADAALDRLAGFMRERAWPPVGGN